MSNGLLQAETSYVTWNGIHDSSFSIAWIQCFWPWAIGIQYVPAGRVVAVAGSPYGWKSATASGAERR